jgi:O-antigen ligase
MTDNKKLASLIFVALFLLAVGLLTSISVMAGFHVLMIPAILLCLRGYSWKSFPKSGWALLGFSVVLVLSVVFNQPLIARPLKNALKTKYFLLGALSIIPLQFYFQRYLVPEKRVKALKTLLLTLLISATIATLSGLIGYFTGYNPLRMAEVQTARNGGLFGMLITYAHSIAWLNVFLIVMCADYEKFKGLITKKWLYFFTSVSLVGLFTTYTRGAWIAFLAGCLLINKKFTALLVALCVVGVVALSIHDSGFWEKHILRRSSNSERWGCILGAVKAFQEKPVLGYGYLNFEPYSKEIKSKYHLPEASFGGHAHNDFAEILATSGALGALFFLMWLGLWIKEILHRGGLTSQMLIPFVAAFLVSGLTHVSLNDGENAFFLMIIYALSGVL